MPAYRADLSAERRRKAEAREARSSGESLQGESVLSKARSVAAPGSEGGDVNTIKAARYAQEGVHMMRLTGFSAIEYAEKEGLKLNKHPDRIEGPRLGLSIAEAEAIASEDEDLIWLDVPNAQYAGEQRNMEPER
jgi:hypothetical protein